MKISGIYAMKNIPKKLIPQNLIVGRNVVVVKDLLINKRFGHVLLGKYIVAILAKVLKKHIKLTEEEINSLNNTTEVRDHCRITGKYRGLAHQKCNRSCRLTDKIPVIFHHLRGYESHFIM